MKKVLIITYYWPPGGGAGVQRWLKFTKYLPQYGWQPVIYTPENGEMPVIDKSLANDIPPGVEVIRTNIWEPYSIYKKFVGAGKHEKINTGFLTEKKKPGLAEKLSVWLRGNLFIPDARCYWIKPSVAYLTSYLEKNHVDAIVSTGPPHSMHLIALPLSRKFNIPWIADFRDPWTNIDYYSDLMLTPLADKKHHRLEREVITSATRVIVVGNDMKHEFEKKYGKPIDVITNGFDTDDILLKKESNPVSPPASPGKFILAHVGTLVRSRNPLILWKALADLISGNPDFANHLQVRLTGKVDIAVRNSIAERGLEPFVTYIDYLPHDQVISEQQKASVLLLVLNNTPNAKGILTGKLFEYLAARRPILCIGPEDGDAATILREIQSGVTVNFEDYGATAKIMGSMYQKFQSGTLTVPGTGVDKYSRKMLTGELVKVMNEIIL